MRLFSLIFALFTLVCVAQFSTASAQPKPRLAPQTQSSAPPVKGETPAIQSSETDGDRPAQVRVDSFGNTLPQFQGVIENIGTKYTMFLPDGTPNRAAAGNDALEKGKQRETHPEITPQTQQVAPAPLPQR